MEQTGRMPHPISDEALDQISGGGEADKQDAITNPYLNYCTFSYRCMYCGNGILGHAPGCMAAASGYRGGCCTCKHFSLAYENDVAVYRCAKGERPYIYEL